MEEKICSTLINGKEFSIRSGKIAKQASGAVIVQQGETIVQVTVVGSQETREDINFLPLSVEYQEKFMQQEEFLEIIFVVKSEDLRKKRL